VKSTKQLNQQRRQDARVVAAARRWGKTAALVVGVTSLFGCPAIRAAVPPAWVGSPGAAWTTKIGGGLWYQEGAVIQGIAPAIQEYPKPLLIGLRSGVRESGYRFDLNSFDPSMDSYSWWSDRMSHEDVINALMPTGKAEFMMSIPTPDHYSATPPSSNDGSGYPWQQPRYYAAYLQYLLEPATMTPGAYMALNPVYDFFSDASCSSVNSASEAAVGGNWGNLRARRGHPQPYPIEAVVLGIEAYGGMQEAFEGDGARYGRIVEAFKNAIRARGGALTAVPLGIQTDGMALTDSSRPWFPALAQAITPGDYSYLDLYHKYELGDPSTEFNRIYPGAIAPDGWQNWWEPRSTWTCDFTRMLWQYEDAKVALTQRGQDVSRWKIGCAEHGMTVSSRFAGNDMGGALHWALWLSEIMRYNPQWDLNWVLAEQGWSHAQLHYRDGHLTRTPAHYVYKMAQELSGLERCDNSYESPTALTGTAPASDGNRPFTSPDVVVRVFRNSADGHYHLFVVNKSATTTASLAGWESWNVVKWDRLNASAFTDQNPIGNPWAPESIKTMSVSAAAGQPFAIVPISVNHIEVSDGATGGGGNSTVTVAATDADATIGTTDDGVVTFSRTGDLGNALTVQYAFTGNARTWDDFQLPNGTMPDTIQFPAGAATVAMTIVAHGNVNQVDPEYAGFTLINPSGYTIGAASSAIVNIHPSGPPVVTVVATDADMTIGTSDHGLLTFSRTGDTTAALTVQYAFDGNAVTWDDFRKPDGTMPDTITFPAGASTVTLEIAAYGNSHNANPEYASFRIYNPNGYVVGSPSSATINIHP
jgi:hypothetical protein